MRDVVGEVVNMMTGRLKYYMPGKTEMSLPIVATGDTLGIAIPGSTGGICEVATLGCGVQPTSPRRPSAASLTHLRCRVFICHLPIQLCGDKVSDYYACPRLPPYPFARHRRRKT